MAAASLVRFDTAHSTLGVAFSHDNQSVSNVDVETQCALVDVGSRGLRYGHHRIKFRLEGPLCDSDGRGLPGINVAIGVTSERDASLSGYYRVESSLCVASCATGAAVFGRSASSGFHASPGDLCTVTVDCKFGTVSVNSDTYDHDYEIHTCGPLPPVWPCVVFIAGSTCCTATVISHEILPDTAPNGRRENSSHMYIEAWEWEHGGHVGDDSRRRDRYQGIGQLLLMAPRASDLTLWDVDTMPTEDIELLFHAGAAALKATRYVTEPMSFNGTISFDQDFTSIMMSTRSMGSACRISSCVAFRPPVSHFVGADACGKIDVSPEANPGVKWLNSKWLLLVIEGDRAEVLLIDVAFLRRIRDGELVRLMPPFCYATASYTNAAMDATWREIAVRQLRNYNIARRVVPDEYGVFHIRRAVRDVVVWFSP